HQPEPDGPLVKTRDPVAVSVRRRTGDRARALTQPAQQPLDVARRDARERPIAEVHRQASELRLRVAEGSMLAAGPLFVVGRVRAEREPRGSSRTALRRRAPSGLAEGPAAAIVVPLDRLGLDGADALLVNVAGATGKANGPESGL